MHPCQLCGRPTQTLERIHTPCLYALLTPLDELLEKPLRIV